jgi:hypothetical protein
MKPCALCPQAGEMVGGNAGGEITVASAAPKIKTPQEKAGDRSFMPYNLFVRRGAASVIGAQMRSGRDMRRRIRRQ